MSETDYCLLGEGYCRWCRYCIIKYKEDQRLTDDQLFGETDLETENQRLREANKQLQGKVKRLNAFLVEQGLAIEYVKWNKER